MGKKLLFMLLYIFRYISTIYSYNNSINYENFYVHVAF